MGMAFGIAFFLIGSVVLFAGAISIIKPITLFRIRSRKDGAVVVLAGLLMVIFSLFLVGTDNPEDATVAIADGVRRPAGTSEKAPRVEEAQRIDEAERVNDLEQRARTVAGRAKRIPPQNEEGERQLGPQEAEKKGANKKRKFIDVIRKYQAAYKTATNDIKRFNYVKDRSRELKGILHDDLQVKNWVGNLLRLSTDSAGNADIAVELADGITLGTYGLFQDIKPDTSLWKQVAELTIGQEVFFSGQFFASASARFPKELSLTERGNMAAPQFYFDFLSIKPHKAPK